MAINTYRYLTRLSFYAITNLSNFPSRPIFIAAIELPDDLYSIEFWTQK
jgi:hypothetical protein